MSNFGVTGAVMRINCDLPPPYEQALKFPSIGSLPPGHCNPVMISTEALNLAENGFHQDLSSNHQSQSQLTSKNLTLGQASLSESSSSERKAVSKPPEYADSV